MIVFSLSGCGTLSSILQHPFGSAQFSEFTLSIKVIMKYNLGRSNLWKGTHAFLSRAVSAYAYWRSMMNSGYPAYPNPTITEAVCDIHFRLPQEKEWRPSFPGELFKHIQNEYPEME